MNTMFMPSLLYGSETWTLTGTKNQNSRDENIAEDSGNWRTSCQLLSIVENTKNG